MIADKDINALKKAYKASWESILDVLFDIDDFNVDRFVAEAVSHMREGDSFSLISLCSFFDEGTDESNCNGQNVEHRLNYSDQNAVNHILTKYGSSYISDIYTPSIPTRMADSVEKFKEKARVFIKKYRMKFQSVGSLAIALYSVNPTIESMRSMSYQSLKEQIIESKGLSDSVAAKMRSTQFDPTFPSGEGLARVSGLDDVKALFNRCYLMPMNNPRLAKQFNVHKLNGMLLAGPPGCGKTFVAEAMAESSGCAYFNIKFSDIGTGNYYETEQTISAIFAYAEKTAPSLIFIDEIDAMVFRRDRDPKISTIVNQFLTEMNNCSQRGIFVIGATNRLEDIDPAVMRPGRLDKTIYVSLPDESTRESLISGELAKIGAKGDIDIKEAARKAEGLSCADIINAIMEASFDAFVSAIDGDADAQVSGEAVMDALSSAERSVKEDEIRKYRIAFRNKVSGETRIGF